jgi:hypothetical protein
MRLFVLAALALSSAAGAQSSRDSARLQAILRLEPPVPIKIQLRERTYEGRFLHLDGTTMVLTPRGAESRDYRRPAGGIVPYRERRIATQDVEKVWVERISVERGSVLTGIVTGGIGGALANVLAYKVFCRTCQIDYGQKALQGLVVGAVLGGIEEPRRVRQRRRWQEVFPSAPGSP